MENGWINFYKEIGITSNKALLKVKRQLNIKKIGYAGTLDPFAYGVLPLAIGKSTKQITQLMENTKKYYFEIIWGTETDSTDNTGTIINTGGNIPTENDIKTIMSNFIGKFKQRPHKFSAVHVNGKRAYDLARSGEDFILPYKDVNVVNFVMHSATSFEIECHSGFYIRSLVRDMAELLSTYGYVNKLGRLSVGNFKIEDTVKFSDIEECGSECIKLI